ncbi:pentapeptide repeat-containing protein [Nocardia aurantiaca]|uniref:Pentapeptide repeat-containing protein n=1 Tax=Nocardia aurantiaca TaxID=2675850 RepID=A0A6I3L873_9NOCA|nr:pentapeptide repeat-containing protein [Nocardia aurantiaca]MTE17250.1 pentapeptide repeat-containing protein [Nocardia aurantiaca]
MPRELADLPFARFLEQQDTLLDEGAYDCAHFGGLSLDDPHLRGVSFTECAISATTVNGGFFRHSRFNDVWLGSTRWIRTDLSETNWLEAEFVLAALSGVEAFGSVLRRVSFHNCKFDSVNLRGAVLTDVTFVDCVLRDVDIAEATLTSVTFPGSEISGLSLRNATLKQVDLREARSIGISGGIESLSGAMVTHTQLLELAPVFAHALGITVKDL